jgi:uncharacterized membrane protein YeaQ/YmgE (transglycosylase-associated protein family)
MFSKKSYLTLLALFLGGFVPIQLITFSFGYSQYYKGIKFGPKVIKVAHEFGEPYFLYLYIPSILVLIWVILYCKKHYADLYRRIVVGLLAGAIATIGLDWIRQMGVISSWLPGDTPAMFGKMVTGSSSFSSYYWIGQFIHFMNGANFGLFFVLVFGNFINRKKTIMWALIWAITIELGMMTLPPIAPMLGFFGYNFAWPQLFLLTLIAHIVYGTILGILVHEWLKPEDNTWLLPFLKTKN